MRSLSFFRLDISIIDSVLILIFIDEENLSGFFGDSGIILRLVIFRELKILEVTLNFLLWGC